MVQRLNILILYLNGINKSECGWYAGCHQRTVQRCITRADGDIEISDRDRSGRPPKFTESAIIKTIAFYCQNNPVYEGVGWTLRWASDYLNSHPEILGCSISYSSIWRSLQKHSLKPHKVKYFLQITDPDFFPKMEAIIQLYRERPEYLFCFDECPGIQALQRYNPSLPPEENRDGYKEFDYIRHGTTNLFAFLQYTTGNVFARCACNHNSETLATILYEHINQLPQEAEIHYICDNYATHFNDMVCKAIAKLSNVSYSKLKTGKERKQWLASNDKRIIFHFLPFHGSWLNLVEIWFGIMKGKCIKNRSFISIEQLAETLYKFVELWNNYYAHPFSWNYKGENLHGKVVRRFCKLLLIESKEMNKKFLKKQLLLMNNLVEDYYIQVKQINWNQLLELLISKNCYIENIISGEEKIQVVLKQLINLLSFKLDMKLAA